MVRKIILRNKDLGKPFSLKTFEQKRKEKIILDFLLFLWLFLFILAIANLFQKKNIILSIFLIIIAIFLYLLFTFKIDNVIKNLQKAGYKTKWFYGLVNREGYFFWLKGSYEPYFYLFRYRKFLNGKIQIKDIGKPVI